MEEIENLMAQEEKKTSSSNYFWQPIIAMLFFGVSLFCIDWVAKSPMLWVACSGALATSAYIVFVLPTSPAAAWYNILAGYVFAVVFGELLHWLAVFFEWTVAHTFMLPSVHVYEFTAFIGLLFTMWLMLLFRIAHPPAIIITLTMMMVSGHYLLLVVTLAAAVLLTILKVILSPVLRDLVGASYK
jgi:hypothetical protein